MKLDHKQLAAKYWGIMHPKVNFYLLKEEQIQNQYSAMQKFLETLKEMEAPSTPTGGFFDGNGELVNSGDRVLYLIDGRKGTMIDALQDGDADIRWDTGKCGQVKWNNLRKI